jgi:fructose-1,6-bisphosphatase/inositol monophosphatase family enzyme
LTLAAAQLTEISHLLRAAARAEILPRFRNLSAADQRQKTGPLDLVTAADEAAERHITDGLARMFPGCLIVGEEAASADPSLLSGLIHAELAFVVDPVDGTANFAAGLPLFGVMVAALRHGEIIATAIFDPIGDDTAMALRGEGAWTERNDGFRNDLQVAAPVPLAEMFGGASWRYLPEPLRSTVAANIPKLAAAFDYRCAAHQYRMLAAGHCHFMLFGRLYPWDHAPGWLLHAEAGGYAAAFDGTRYDPGRIDGGLICAPDEASYLALRQALLARH